jgi:hypothetical protein
MVKKGLKSPFFFTGKHQILAALADIMVLPADGKPKYGSGYNE